jgi:hypothetical protein
MRGALEGSFGGLIDGAADPFRGGRRQIELLQRVAGRELRNRYVRVQYWQLDLLELVCLPLRWREGGISSPLYQ